MTLQKFLQKILCFIIFLKIISCHNHSLKSNTKNEINYENRNFTKYANQVLKTTTEIYILPTNFNIF